MRFLRNELRAAAAIAVAAAAACFASLVLPSGSQAFYVYYCPGYHSNNEPTDCHANPYASPGAHSWLPRRAVPILASDGYSRAAGLLRSPLDGKTYLDWIVEGAVAADRGRDGQWQSGLNGCTAYGRSIGWPLGDHELNPYRHFGAWSYFDSPILGWAGFGYANSAGRTIGACSSAPRVRTNGALMVDEFFTRAKTAWQAGRRRDAMFNLGIALHPVHDAAVPSHAHPEVDVHWLRVRDPNGNVVPGRDAFPAWVNEHLSDPRLGASSGGLYDPPSSANGVTVADTPGGWAYWMAALSYPYFPWDSSWSAIPRESIRCDVTDFPEACPNASIRIVQRAQRVSAGFIRYFFASVGDPAASR